MIEPEMGSRKSAPGRVVFGMVAGVRCRRLVWLFTPDVVLSGWRSVRGLQGLAAVTPSGQFLIVSLESWVPFLIWSGLQCPMR